jgi:hypothetical protein
MEIFLKCEVYSCLGQVSRAIWRLLMEKIKSTAKIFWNRLEQWSPQILTVFLLSILTGSVGWVVQDSRAGHQELQSAAIVEKIYRRAVEDEILVPLAEPTGGCDSLISESR